MTKFIGKVHSTAYQMVKAHLGKKKQNPLNQSKPK